MIDLPKKFRDSVLSMAERLSGLFQRLHGYGEQGSPELSSAASIRPSTPAQEGVATTVDSIDGRARATPESLLINVMAWGR